ncbi:hypothetical protein [Clostridium saccharobutylicum]|uniref:Lipoprotein n=2 Tax=Clostridium saccharobutylicum TaxID=169679 RepID=U5MXJ9_CLOSA|nr:hypothetical protein [Clostridium saccharobutylicum]AGX44346.1 hypothetical protein CLSA_c33830 [Clostridium saccharobutylicum DSM 13864]AQR91639.1 hypothetical protein CLOSC_33650 [Clostridium saccharobutylicum]AQS01544.1 hypothetical protein CSACC_33730 [Clostridium saccharobutylicum]AQS11151.1 hypothetical protein CLOBY_33050 [Clostridium saccharobutylicum]AQS15527.1 hypothetical protein CLOSACC_33730 [Clostridium saccharobutylicum]
MKRIQIILSVAVMLITLSGCGNQKVQSNDSTKDTAITTDNQENTTTDIKDNNVAAQKDSDNTNSNKKDSTNTNTNKTEKSTNNNTSSQNTSKESNKDQKSFYGNWELKKVAGYAKVSAGADDSLIGEKMSFSSQVATVGDVSYNNPKYTTTNQTQNTIVSDYHTNLSKIGVDTDSITELDISNQNGEGATLFIKDNDTLLYFVEGVFYEVKRIS